VRQLTRDATTFDFSATFPDNAVITSKITSRSLGISLFDRRTDVHPKANIKDEDESFHYQVELVGWKFNFLVALETH
jgi:hypothetical protein